MDFNLNPEHIQEAVDPDLGIWSGWSMETGRFGVEPNQMNAKQHGPLASAKPHHFYRTVSANLDEFPGHMLPLPVVKALLVDRILLYWIWMTGARFSMWVRSITRQWAGFLKMAWIGHRLNRPVLIPESMRPRRMCCENQVAAIGCTIWSTDTQVGLAYPRVQMEDNGALSNSLWKTEMRSIYLWPWIWVGSGGGPLLQSH